MIQEENEQLEQMSFWDHIDAFRAVMIRAILTIIAFSTIFFIFMNKIFDNVILAPCSSDFIVYRKLCSALAPIGVFDALCAPFSIDLINYNLNAQFYTHLSTSFWLGLIFSFPILMYHLWNFISPALYAHERRSVIYAFSFGNILFYTGILVGYFMIFPLTLRFFATYTVSSLIENAISLESYMSNFLSLIFLLGLAFELPLLCKLLSAMGLLKRRFFSQYRKHAIVALMILAAILTPADPFSMLLLFFPLWLLFVLSAFLVIY